MSVFGLWPMAMNTPISATSLSGAALTSLMRTPVTPDLSPRTRRARDSTDGHLPGALPFEQLVLHDLLGAKFVATMHHRDMVGDVGEGASSTVVLPPPTTATFWFL